MRLDAIHQMCTFSNYSSLSTQSQFTNDSIYKIIDDIAPTRDSVFDDCVWRGKSLPFDKYMVKVFTEVGICFQFNGLNSYEMYTEK